MATYVITETFDENTSDGEWGKSRFKHRYKSSQGFPTAQDEFDRRSRNGEPAVLWKWENHQPTLIDHCNIDHCNIKK